MGQIMRLRRIAGSDHHIDDRNNGYRHEHAFVDDHPATTACCTRPTCCPSSYGGNSCSASSRRLRARSCSRSLPVDLQGMLRGKITPARARCCGHKIPKADLKEVQAIYDKVESRQERYELNLYVTGEDEDERRTPPVAAGTGTESGRPRGPDEPGREHQP